MSNRVEWFKHVAYIMPYPRAAICIAMYSYSLAIIRHNYMAMYSMRAPAVNDSLPITLFTVQLLSIRSRFHYIQNYGDTR